jgi:hypothetical protein
VVLALPIPGGLGTVVDVGLPEVDPAEQEVPTLLFAQKEDGG